MIIDEVHERDVNTDFLLIVMRRLVQHNPRIRVVLMSATMDLKQLQRYFGGAKILDVPGRTFPVTCYYLEDTIEMLDYRPPDTQSKAFKRKMA